MEWLENWRTYWFVPGFFQYVYRDTEIPFDQQQLMAAIAPRKLYVASADKDDYADPAGEFAAAQCASAAWNSALKSAAFPASNCGTGDDSVRYFLRPGEHDFNQINWDDLIEHAGKVFLN